MAKQKNLKSVPCPERTLEIKIRSTEKYCFTWWPDEDKRCPHIMTSHFGAKIHCGVFGGIQLLEDEKDRVLRCEPCLKAERRSDEAEDRTPLPHQG